VKDPETGRFMGRKPGCSNDNAGLSSEKSIEVRKEKDVIRRRVELASASGRWQPKDSESKDKAQQLAHEVNSGKMSYEEGLNKLSKDGQGPNRYGMAAEIIKEDVPYWTDIASKAGSDTVDTLMAGFTGGVVPGVTDFALKTSDATSSAQTSDNKPLDLPSGKSKEEVDAKHDEWLDAIKKKAYDYNELNKKGRFNKFTKCSGNECETKASFYAKRFEKERTTGGDIFTNYGYTAAMHTIYVGKYPYKKEPGKYAYAEVTNKANGKSVIVKINDKGPHSPIVYNSKKEHVNLPDPTKGIDLSVAAYAAITHKKEEGILDVKIKFLPPSEGLSRYEKQIKEAAKHKEKIKREVDEILRLHKQ
jgi:rare lipoprotein A